MVSKIRISTFLTALTAEEGVEHVRDLAPDVCCSTCCCLARTGSTCFSKSTRSIRKLPVIYITAHGNSDTAIEAMSNGAYDYLMKPLDLPAVRHLVERALDIRRLMRVPVDISLPATNGQSGDSLVGRSSKMQEVYKAIGRVAPQDVIVLIRGESGTGKELVARAIYQHSPRCRWAVSGGQLRGHSRGAAGKRTVRA